MKIFNLPGHGLRCGNCDAPLLKVSRKIQTPGFLIRVRICPKCGASNETCERLVSTVNRRATFTEPHQ